MKDNIKQKRRAKGEGYLKEIAPNKWEGREVLKRENGTEIIKSVTRNTKQEVIMLKNKLRALQPLDNNVDKIKINKFNNEIILIRKEKSPTNGLSKETTVEKYIDYWLFHHRRNGLKGRRIVDNTFADYVQKCDILKRKIGKLKMRELTFEIIQNTLLEIHSETSDTTATQVKNHVYNMMNFAKKDKVISENPLEENAPIQFQLSKKRNRRKVLDRTDEDKVIEYCLKNQFYDIIVLMFSATRISELAGITWQDIIWDKNQIVINKEFMAIKQYEYQNGELICTGKKKQFTDTKTISSDRNCFVPKEVIQCLYIQKENQKHLAKKLGIEFKETDFVFTSNRYNPYDRDDYWLRVRKVMEALKIKNWKSISPHKFRANFCLRAAEQGVDACYVKDVLGHSNISTTLSYYWSTSDEVVKETANKVNAGRLNAFGNI